MVTINTLRLAKIIINVTMRHCNHFNWITSNWRLVFTSKFWLLFFYFLKIKQNLLTAFYSKSNSQTKKQNSNIEVYLQLFVNFKYNNWARLLLIAKFVYNNAKNSSISHMLFTLNCNYHPRVFSKVNI